MEEKKIKVLKYDQITEELKEQIFSGEFHAGEKIPSENELSAKYRVSRQTVRKALAILQNKGYLYAEHGRGTFCSELVRHTKASHNIAVVTTYLSDYIFPRVIKGIDEVLTEYGYSILLKNTRNSRNQEAKCLEELLQKEIDGVIIEPSKSQIFCRHLGLYQKLEEYGIPYVFIQGCFAQLKDRPHILMDDCKGGYLITKYLIDLGHRNMIGVFKADDSQGLNRHKGYVMALKEAGIDYDPDKVIWFYTEDRAIHPYQGIKQIAAEKRIKMDAVVCYNDQIAVEVIRALNESGLNVPEDVSVTGYDNSYLAQMNGIRLTTIAHPQEKLGEMAAELLIDLIRKRESTEKDVIEDKDAKEDKEGGDANLKIEKEAEIVHKEEVVQKAQIVQEGEIIQKEQSIQKIDDWIEDSSVDRSGEKIRREQDSNHILIEPEIVLGDSCKLRKNNL